MREDHVSMGWSAARKLRTAIGNLTRIVAVELYAATRGVELRAGLTRPPPRRPSSPPCARPASRAPARTASSPRPGRRRRLRTGGRGGRRRGAGHRPAGVRTSERQMRARHLRRIPGGDGPSVSTRRGKAVQEARPRRRIASTTKLAPTPRNAVPPSRYGTVSRSPVSARRPSSTAGPPPPPYPAAPPVGGVRRRYEPQGAQQRSRDGGGQQEASGCGHGDFDPPCGNHELIDVQMLMNTAGRGKPEALRTLRSDP